MIAGLAGCERPAAPAPANGASTAAPTKPQPAQVNSVELVFPYGSEKKAWIDAATQEFVASGVKTASGRSIVIKPLPMGSGDVVDETLSGRLQAHIVSPASAAFVKLGNAKSQATTGGPLVGQTQDLVLSPVVIAMWKPMAEALGWPKKEIGWSDVLAVANDPSGWASVGKPQWGAFRFGHTHPKYSNSGLMAVIAQIRKLQADQQTTQNRIDALVAQGNQQQAAQIALRFHLINQQLDENTRQAKAADVAFR